MPVLSSFHLLSSLPSPPAAALGCFRDEALFGCCHMQATVQCRKDRLVAEVRCLKQSYGMFWRCTILQNQLLSALSSALLCPRQYCDYFYFFLMGLTNFLTQSCVFPQCPDLLEADADG